jgi:hypothetical protein
LISHHQIKIRASGGRKCQKIYKKIHMLEINTSSSTSSICIIVFITRMAIINSNILIAMKAAKYKSIEAASPSLTVSLNL